MISAKPMICVPAMTTKVNMSKQFVISWLDYSIKTKFLNMMLALKWLMGWLNQMKELANFKKLVQKIKPNSKKPKKSFNFRKIRPKNLRLNQDTSMTLWKSSMVWRILMVSNYAKSSNQAFNRKVKTEKKSRENLTILA